MSLTLPANVAQKSTTRTYSLVLVPGDNADAFARQLEQIVAMTDDDAYDVVVVDRGHSVLVQKVLMQLEGDVQIINADSDMTYAEVCNRVVEFVNGHNLVFVAPDAEVYPGWLRFIDEAFVADPQVAIVRSADSDIIALTSTTFAKTRGFNLDSRPGQERQDFCFYAATQGFRVAFDRNRAMGPSKLRWQYLTQGYVKLEGFIDPAVCDRIIAEGEAYYASRGVDAYNVNRVMNFHRISNTALNDYLISERLTAVLRELFAEDPLFLQTILFYQGSQQDLHSDWIYMSTNLHHRLMGAWLALEDVHDDAGPLRYLPGSQRLPIESIFERWERLSPEIERKLTSGELPPENWRKPPHESGKYGHLYYGWEQSIGPAAIDAGYNETRFLAKKGDVLLWHANLIHGGTPIENPASTRRSIVAHFLTREISSYADINYPDNGRALGVPEVEIGAANVVPDLRIKKLS